MSVSVFGVYKDGLMSADAWSELAPRLRSALAGAGDPSCAPFYGDALVRGDRALVSAIDDEARSEGPTDALLDLFAPAATGDAILLVSVAGHPPRKKAKATTADVSPPVSGGGGLHRSRGVNAGADPNAMSGSQASRGHEAVDHDAYEVSVSLFSVRDHRPVAIVAMTYTGASVDEALAAFVEKVRTELPAMRCAGWKPDVHVAPESVQRVGR
jgi:hypothetical protein